jgi:hypothetical protein
VHGLQDEGTVGVEALQAFRAWVRSFAVGDSICLKVERLTSENSGDKKTKGAALVF